MGMGMGTGMGMGPGMGLGTGVGEMTCGKVGMGPTAGAAVEPPHDVAGTSAGIRPLSAKLGPAVLAESPHNGH